MSLVNACADNGLSIAVSGVRYDPSKIDEWLPLVFQGVMAEAEARRIRQRNLDSVTTNALRGSPHGRKPYGYRREYDSETGVLVRQTPFVSDSSNRLLPEAQVLADAADAVLAGVPLRQICRDLNRAGIPTSRKPRRETLQNDPSGVVTAWDPATLRQLLRNPTIAGRRVHQGEDIGPAAWEPIIEYGKWLKLHDLLTDPLRLTVTVPRGPAPRHLLSGIARCGECGARMKAATNMSRMPRAYTCRAEGCMSVTASADRVDERVIEVLLAYLARADTLSALNAAEHRRQLAMSKEPGIGSLIALAESELAAVEALRGAGELTLRAYAAETKRIEGRIDDLRSRQVHEVESPAIRRLLSAKTARDGWDQADLLDQREVIKLLFDVTIAKAARRGRSFDPMRVVIQPSSRLTTSVRGSLG